MEYGLACGTILPPFDQDRLAPFPFAGEPIFICVDIEANEHYHNDITEIGISVLDLTSLVLLQGNLEKTGFLGSDLAIFELKKDHTL